MLDVMVRTRDLLSFAYAANSVYPVGRDSVGVKQTVAWVLYS